MIFTGYIPHGVIYYLFISSNVQHIRKSINIIGGAIFPPEKEKLKKSRY